MYKNTFGKGNSVDNTSSGTLLFVDPLKSDIPLFFYLYLDCMHSNKNESVISSIWTRLPENRKN